MKEGLVIFSNVFIAIMITMGLTCLIAKIAFEINGGDPYTRNKIGIFFSRVLTSLVIGLFVAFMVIFKDTISPIFSNRDNVLMFIIIFFIISFIMKLGRR